MSDFNVDLTELREYARGLRLTQAKLRGAISMSLNSIAFEARKRAPDVIAREMTARNKRFISSSFAVEKSTSSTLVATMGSVTRPRFTGWAEQEGARSTRRRVPTNTARGGSFKNQVRGAARFKSGNKFYRPEQFQARTQAGQFGFMMRVLGSRGGGNILITEQIKTKRGTLSRGLYEFKNHKIKRLQDTHPSNTQPARHPWMERVIATSATQGNIEREWQSNLNRILNGSR